MKVCRDCIHFDACAAFWYSDYDCVANIEDSKHKHGIEEACEQFKSTADVVEVRHGHWKYLWLDAVCSECGYINEADAVTRCRTDPPYCPKCGAKMDGERSANGT